MIRKFRRTYWCLILALGTIATWDGHREALAEPASTITTSASGLSEQVIRIPKDSGLLRVELEATVFKPSGSGPFPLIVLNHGKAPGKPAFQKRARYSAQSAEFVRRGYVVVIPMRQGFADSGGRYIEGGCNVESNGISQAEDVVATLDFMVGQPYVDRKRIVVMGQSHGGLTTMAFSTLNYPGVLGLVNFAGGLRQDGCGNWEGNLVDAFGSYGSKARYPSLWVYGDNDSYWPIPMPGRMFDAYKERTKGAAANTRMLDVGVFEGDSHRLFSERKGIPLWLPAVGNFIRSLGLPFDDD